MNDDSRIKVGTRVMLINRGKETCYKVGDKGVVTQISRLKNDYGCGVDFAILVKYENGKSWWCTKNMLAPLFCKAVI